MNCSELPRPQMMPAATAQCRFFQSQRYSWMDDFGAPNTGWYKNIMFRMLHRTPQQGLLFRVLHACEVSSCMHRQDQSMRKPASGLLGGL
jgi:hypothetical protein